MAIELQRIVPGVKGDAGVDTGRTSAAKINAAFDALEEVANEQYPGKMDINGLNSAIDKLYFKPENLQLLSRVGELRYSQQYDTLELKTPYATIQLGQEMQEVSKNDHGDTIFNGRAVYISSALGANSLIKLSTSSNQDIAQKTFGVATVDIPANGFGAITTEGVVRDFNTSSFSEGDQLYLGIDGNLTNIEPVAPLAKVFIGIVLRSHVEFGSIYVKIRPIARLQKLSDVFAPVLTNGDVLVWNSTNARWQTFNLDSALASKVNLSGDQTITGVKTFETSPIIPEPTELNQAANKNYVDEKDSEIRDNFAFYLDTTAAFDIDSNYNLIFTKPDNVVDEFSINTSGELILTR